MSPLNRNQLLNERCRNREKDEAFSAVQIHNQLLAIPDWKLAGQSITRTYSFKNYYQTLAFVNAIAYVIHSEDHHPDLIVGYNRCEVRFNTHSVNGISLNDFICAAKCDAIFELTGATLLFGLIILAKTIDQKLRGRVIAAHGRNYAVRTEADLYLNCFTRGKKSEVACGDYVEIDHIANDQGVITSIVDRRNLLYRSDAFRKKVLAANLSLMMIVVATEPSFSEDLLGRALVAAEALELPTAIVLNKIDLMTSLELARARLALYTNLGYPVYEVSVRNAPEQTLDTLLPHLQDGTTLLLGQSGMGKSSLLNLLIPDAQAATREISEVLHSGKHTTTDSRLYDLRAEDGRSIGSVIDTPGFQEFGLAHLTPGQIERGFPEFESRLGNCRFYNCSHLAEPDCAIRTGVTEGAIEARRYELFTSLTRE